MNRFVNLAKRVILINYALASIPIFFLSFLKMSNKIWKFME